MLYYSKNSRNKILHLDTCFSKGQIHDENIGKFESLQEAYEEGYRLCHHCSPLACQYRKLKDEACRYSMKKGIRFYLNDNAVVVKTSLSKWKIVVAETGKRLALYHKNTYKSAHDDESLVEGYRLQNIRKGTIQAYLEYIAKHDDYRISNPVCSDTKTKKESPHPRKGTKRYKTWRHEEEQRARKYSLWRTLSLIEELSCQTGRGLNI